MRRLFIILIIALPISLILVEIASRQDCANIRNFKNPCFELVDKHYKNVDVETAFEIYVELIGEKEKGQITDQEIERVVQEKTAVVPRADIKGLNGISCGIYNFVSEDLPPKALRYVKIHEAIHYLGISNETKTNYLAATKEPLGFIQTIFYSVFKGKTTDLKDVPCRLGRLWNAFKIYFLDF